MVVYLAQFIDIFFNLLSFAIFARVLLSWFPNAGAKIQMIFYDLTEPVLAPIRRVIPRVGMMDISPIVAWLLMDLVRTILLSLLNYL